MSQDKQHTTFPSDLPAPEDKGELNHLRPPNARFPSVTLTSTHGASVDVTQLSGLTILFLYPRTGAPGEDVPKDWNEIPGARGCTPQACGFRDLHTALQDLGVSGVYGISTQSTSYQKEAAERLQLPYALLSDEGYALLEKARLPFFEYQGRKVLRRAAFAIENSGEVVKVWYPVFPPDRNAQDVVAWLEERKKEKEGMKPERPRFFAMGSYQDI